VILGFDSGQIVIFFLFDRIKGELGFFFFVGGGGLGVEN